MLYISLITFLNYCNNKLFVKKQKFNMYEYTTSKEIIEDYEDEKEIINYNHNFFSHIDV